MTKLSQPAAQVLAMVRECLRLNEKERAVIEAAKAFIADAQDDILVPWHDLRRAVEALQEVE